MSNHPLLSADGQLSCPCRERISSDAERRRRQNVAPRSERMEREMQHNENYLLNGERGRGGNAAPNNRRSNNNERLERSFRRSGAHHPSLKTMFLREKSCVKIVTCNKNLARKILIIKQPCVKKTAVVFLNFCFFEYSAPGPAC